jgi:phenylacetate-CoA ligase
LSKAEVLAVPKEFLLCTPWPVSRAVTGGTTGSPLPVIRTLASVATEQSAIDLAMQRLGLDASRVRVAVLRADHVQDPSDRRPPFWKIVAGGTRLVLSTPHLAADTLANYVDAIASFAPDVLWVYPSALESFCLLLQRAGRQISVPSVLSSSEMLSETAWRLAQHVLGCRVVDYYGQAERVAFSVADQFARHRFLAGYGFVELIPLRAEDEYREFEIVGTSLWNSTMPLVRYRTGDCIRLPITYGDSELLEVALGLREFPGVLGRNAEFLVSPEGARIVGLNHFPKGTRHVIRLQLIQESGDHVRVLVLAEDGYGEADQEVLHRNIRAKVPLSIKVAIERVDMLEKTSSEKTPYVIRRMTAETSSRCYE